MHHSCSSGCTKRISTGRFDSPLAGLRRNMPFISLTTVLTRKNRHFAVVNETDEYLGTVSLKIYFADRPLGGVCHYRQKYGAGDGRGKAGDRKYPELCI